MSGYSSKLLLVPLVDKDTTAKCIAIPADARYITNLMGHMAYATDLARHNAAFYSIQYYDPKVRWLSKWPEGYPSEGFKEGAEWRLNHVMAGERQWNDEVVEYIESFLWQPPVSKGGLVTFDAWDAQVPRVLVTQGGVNWIAYDDCPTCDDCASWGYAPKGPPRLEVITYCIADEYLCYIPHVVGEIDQYSR